MKNIKEFNIIYKNIHYTIILTSHINTYITIKNTFYAIRPTKSIIYYNAIIDMISSINNNPRINKDVQCFEIEKDNSTTCLLESLNKIIIEKKIQGWHIMIIGKYS